MSVRVLLISLLAVTLAQKQPVVTKAVTELLKHKAPWRVIPYEKNLFRHWDISEVKHMLSIYRSSRKQPPHTTPTEARSTLPLSHDPRRTANCVESIFDQGACAASWAIACAHSLGDRYCRSKVPQAAHLSPEYLLSCDTMNYGCQGGYLVLGWLYTEQVGTVTEGCFPYISQHGRVEPCPKSCIEGTPLSLFKCKEHSTRDLSYDIETMKEELLKHGPWSTTLVVYQDLLFYQGGVYRHVYGSDMGRQAIRCVGYGSELGEDYWICANSWGRLWGEDGWLRIAFTQADVEGDVWSCTPEVHKQPT